MNSDAIKLIKFDMRNTIDVTLKKPYGIILGENLPHVKNELSAYGAIEHVYANVDYSSTLANMDGYAFFSYDKYREFVRMWTDESGAQDAARVAYFNAAQFNNNYHLIVDQKAIIKYVEDVAKIPISNGAGYSNCYTQCFLGIQSARYNKYTGKIQVISYENHVALRFGENPQPPTGGWKWQSNGLGPNNRGLDNGAWVWDSTPGPGGEPDAWIADVWDGRAYRDEPGALERHFKGYWTERFGYDGQPIPPGYNLGDQKPAFLNTRGDQSFAVPYVRDPVPANVRVPPGVQDMPAYKPVFTIEMTAADWLAPPPTDWEMDEAFADLMTQGTLP